MQTAGPVALWWGHEAPSPVVAVAIHAGHALRDEVAALTAVPRDQRLREEDAGTAAWATRFPTHLVAGRSRFEIDLNRPRHCAVYLQPEDCWDFGPWREPLPPEMADRSRREVYDTVYSVLAGILDRAEAALGRFVVYDLHSYNHRRGGPSAPPADPADHPDVERGRRVNGSGPVGAAGRPVHGRPHFRRRPVRRRASRRPGERRVQGPAAGAVGP